MDENQYRTLPGKLSKAAGHRTGHLNGEQERDEEHPPSPKQLSHIKSHKDYGLSKARGRPATQTPYLPFLLLWVFVVCVLVFFVITNELNKACCLPKDIQSNNNAIGNTDFLFLY